MIGDGHVGEDAFPHPSRIIGIVIEAVRSHSDAHMSKPPFRLPLDITILQGDIRFKLPFPLRTRRLIEVSNALAAPGC